jgi:hypothetical protein
MRGGRGKGVLGSARKPVIRKKEAIFLMEKCFSIDLPLMGGPAYFMTGLGFYNQGFGDII